MGPVTATWLDKLKACIGWNLSDQAQISKLRDQVAPGVNEAVEALSRQWAKFKDTQPPMANARFVRRLHGVLHEWLMGLLDGQFSEEHTDARRALAQRLAEVDLAFEDIIVLESLARRRLLELAEASPDLDTETLLAMVHALDKALCLDLALIHGGYIEVRDAEIERTLLDRFLAITGFSRTLYENLAEAREWSEVSLQQTGVP